MQVSNPVLIGGVPLDAFLAFIFAFIAFLFLGNLAYLLLRRVLDGHVSRGKAKWAAAILQYAVMVGGIYASARYFLEFELTAFIASLGLLGIVVAFSSRQIIQNAVAGILITINRPVQLEEWVIVSGRPETGPCKVRDISFTTTILQGLDGGLVLTPNSSIITSKVINYSRAGLLEVAIPLAVPVTADLLRSRSRSPSRSPPTSRGCRRSPSRPRTTIPSSSLTSSRPNGLPSRTSSTSPTSGASRPTSPAPDFGSSSRRCRSRRSRRNGSG